jgi:anti-anti-sigma factor
MENSQAEIIEKAPGQYVLSFKNRRIIDLPKNEELGDLLFKFAEEKKPDEGARKLVIDCSNMDFLHSPTLDKFRLLNSRLQAQGDHMMMANIRPEIKEVFRTMCLNRIFSIHDTVEQALAAPDARQGAAR